ncbi:MAG TPA: nuclear transport factor 2 family protein [Acidimicrobiales bacterium]
MSAPAPDPRAATAAFWEALYARDWARVRSFFGPDSIYFDVPTGPGAAARGPEDIEKRLRLGLEDLAGYDHGPATVVSGGGIVVTEHTEMWTWPTGETATLPFVSVQHVDGGTITLWKDYWDLGTLVSAAPPDWMDQLMGGDLSWVTDVTGLV